METHKLEKCQRLLSNNLTKVGITLLIKNCKILAKKLWKI